MKKIRHKARLFKRLHVCFEATLLPGGGPVAINCEWDPAVPDLNPRLLNRYKEERHKFLEKVAAEGGTVVCVDQ